MKKILLSVGVIGAFLLYSWHQKNEADNAKVQESQVPTTSIPQPTSIPVQGQYKDGEYTGSVADAFYGNIQVKAVITGGKLTDVVFLQYPNDRPTSIQINTQAMGPLKQEAIAAQSAEVDIVSGATDSCIAFRASLNAALQLAKS